jgi:U3 small nucleolar RNA-associated protein 14
MEEDYDSDLAGEEAVQEAKKGPQISKERMSEAKQEVKAMLGSGMAIHRGRKGALSIGGVSVGASSSASAPRTSLFEFAEDTAAVHSDEEEHAAMERALESNPWLQPVASVTGGKKRKATGTGAKAAMDKSEDAVYINTITTLDGVGKKGKASQKDGPSADANAKKQKKGDQKEPSSVVVETSTASSAQAGAGKEKPAVKISLSEGHTQADLVQMAFAGPDLEAEFHAFKKGEIDTEHGIDEKKTKILSEGKI